MELPVVCGGGWRGGAHTRSPARRRRPQAPVAAGASQVPRNTYRHHLRLADGHPDGVLMTRQPKSQSGQVMVLVAVSLIALIGSAAPVLLSGPAASHKNPLPPLAHQAALHAALRIRTRL